MNAHHTATLTVLLAVVAVALMACSGDDAIDGVPPCTPLEGATGDPCEGDISRGPGGSPGGDNPTPIRWYLDGGYGNLLTGHIVVRGMYKPSTVRCVDQKHHRHHAYTNLGDDWELPTGIGVLKCYADIQVNGYIVGSGPSTLTAVVIALHYWDPYAAAQQIEVLRADAERVLLQGGYHPDIRGVPSGGMTRVESILFLGPEVDASVESWAVFENLGPGAPG